MRRFAVSAIFAGAACAASWYPLQPGDSRVYRNEPLEGDMAHPIVKRWTTEETIVSAVPDAKLKGTLVTLRTRALEGIQREPPESRLLVRDNCIYVFDGSDAELRGLCFPMAAGKTWGRVPTTSPAQEYVWRVRAVNADPYGVPQVNTFHLSAHESSGTVIDRWFAEGVGIVQEITEHHGTYDEERRQLVRSTIGGQTREYQLTPARTVPLSEWDCEGVKWRHFARADGTLFQYPGECTSYSPKTNSR